MNNSLIKNTFLVLLFVFASQPLLAQQTKTGSKQLTTSFQYVTEFTPQAREVTRDIVSDEVLKVYPQAVKYEKRFYPAGKNNFRIKTVKTVDHEKLASALVSSVNEQQNEIEKLKSDIKALKEK